MSVSPWAWSAEVASPNGELVASILDSGEVAMGGPTRGLLRISNGIAVEECNPSMVWSSDSEYLAVPQWTDRRTQRLLVVSMSDKVVRQLPGEYRVLELSSFEDGIISGVDSPIHSPRPVRVDIRRHT